MSERSDERSRAFPLVTAVEVEPTSGGRFRVVEFRVNGFTVLGEYSTRYVANIYRDAAVARMRADGARN